MPSSSLTAFAQDMTDTGQLDVSVVSAATAAPVADAQVSIAYTGDPSGAIEQLTTDNNGQTEAVSLLLEKTEGSSGGVTPSSAAAPVWRPVRYAPAEPLEE